MISTEISYNSEGSAMINFENTKNERRERVFQMLFAIDFNTDRDINSTFTAFYDEEDTIPVSGYVIDTFNGASAFFAEADKKIEADSKNWSTSRMSGVTRTILRLAIYELLKTETPPKVVINEALELSKKFGDEQEPAFINGILNRIAREENKL